MDPKDDFVVVDEECTNSQQILLDRLAVLVDLFSKSLDAVNQSNVLLKDELCSALSVTLQNVDPDASTSVESLVKSLESNVTSTENVRANYTRRLCSRLVAQNEEKQSLLAEMASLKESISNAKKETSDELNKVSTELHGIFQALRALENGSESSSVPVEEVKVETISDVMNSLVIIRQRLLELQLDKEVDQAISVTTAVETRRNLAVQTTERVPLNDEAVQASTQDIGETFEAPSHMRSSAAPGETPQPSFSVEQEEPWCPCCGQTLESRDELESHLQSCLQ